MDMNWGFSPHHTITLAIPTILCQYTTLNVLTMQ